MNGAMDRALTAELRTVGTQLTVTVNLRFVVLGTFAVINGLLFAGYGHILTSPAAFSRVLLVILAIGIGIMNGAFLLLERRTVHALDLIVNRGAEVDASLGNLRSIHIQSRTHRWARVPHGVVLTRLYRWTMVTGVALGIFIAVYWPAPMKEKEELAIAAQAAIIQEIGQLRQQFSAAFKDLKDASGEIAAEVKKTSQETQALRERLTRMERRLPKK